MTIYLDMLTERMSVQNVAYFDIDSIPQSHILTTQDVFRQFLELGILPTRFLGWINIADDHFLVGYPDGFERAVTHALSTARLRRLQAREHLCGVVCERQVAPPSRPAQPARLCLDSTFASDHSLSHAAHYGFTSGSLARGALAAE